MEKYLVESRQGLGLKADKILEINPDHELFKAIKNAYEDKEDITDYARALYDQALLIAGLPIEDPVAYSTMISKIMVRSLDKR